MARFVIQQYTVCSCAPNLKVKASLTGGLLQVGRGSSK